MTDNTSPQQHSPTEGTHELLSLTDLLSVRMAYERATADMYQHFLEKCRHSKDPVVRAMDLAPLEQFHESLTGHIHLLTQALDVIGGRAEKADHDGDRLAPFLIVAKAAQMQAADPQIPILPSMQALLVIGQFNEVAWGLLLALMKDAELQRFVAHLEQVMVRHREQRAMVQHYYEDIALGLVRRHRLTSKKKPSHPTRGGLLGRTSILFGRI